MSRLEGTLPVPAALHADGFVASVRVGPASFRAGASRRGPAVSLGALFFCAALIFSATGARAADCLPSAPQMLELELLECRPAEVEIADRIAGVDLWWLRPYLESVALGNPGVVIRGRALRFREVGLGATILPWDEGDGLEELYFFTSSDPDFCSAFEGIERLTLIREMPCCDTIPPPSVACVLDVAEVRPAPDPGLDGDETRPGLAEERD